MGKHWVLGALFGLAAVVLTAGGCRDGGSSTWSDSGGDVDGGGSHPVDSNAPTIDAELDDGRRPEPEDGGDVPAPVWTPASDPCPNLSDIDFFVDQNHPAASDSNPGTEAAPWRTLDKAAATATAGDCVAVKAGTYAETLAPANSGADGATITFKAYPEDGCKGDSSANGQQLKRDCRVVIENGGVDLYRPYIRIEGFEIKSNAAGGNAVSVAASNAQIVNNFIHNIEGVFTDQIGVAVEAGAPNVLVENNEIREIYRGVKINSPYTQSGVIIRSNHITKTWCDGFRGGADNIIIEGNWIHDRHSTGCHRDALDIHTLTNAIIRNNLIYNFGQYIYIAPDGLPDRVENVQIYGNLVYLSDYPGDPCGEAPGIFIAYDRADDSSPAENIDIHSNTCGWLGYPCIRIHGGPSENYRNFTIRNNILFQSGMDITGVYDITSDYNLFYTDPNAPRSRPTCSDWRKSPANDEATPYVNEGSHSIIGINPGFGSYDYWNNFDFRPSPASPAIDRGSDVGALTDIAGTTRPSGAAHDIGAFEAP